MKAQNNHSVTEALEEVLAPLKPLLRGWIHLITAPVIFIGGLVLLVLTPTAAGRAGVAVYCLTSLALFTTSAVYHRGSWQEKVSSILQRADHANIFLFIAGTYTPFALILFPFKSMLSCLVIIWMIAALGVMFGICWPNCPRWLSAVLYIAMGWASLFWLPDMWYYGGSAVVILLATGGLVYSVGAIIYARKRPDPSPKWFGFHEIFHACTAVAAICHLVAIYLAALS